MTVPNSRVRHAPPSALRFIATFGYAWLMVGLFVGTLVLVVAVRALLDVIQRLGWGQSAQNRLFIVVIVLFVVGSFMLARSIVRALFRRPPTTRNTMLGLLAVPAVLSAYAWTNPARFLSGVAGTKSSSLSMKGGPKFIFGSYPDDDELHKLKKQGVTTVVSLQSPAVLVEISGIRDERVAVAKEGMKFVEAPMLPWVSDNTESLDKIKDLALHGSGTYYVHCGLGRDRVNIAKRLIESLEPQSNARVAGAVDLQKAVGFDRRTEPFERGMPMRISQGAWVVPFLNPEEFYGFIIQGQPGQVILALDPADTLQRRWIAEAERQLKQYAVKYTLSPYPASPRDTSTAAIVALVRAQQPPFTVIVPKTTFDIGDPRDPVARAIGKAFNVSVRPLPKVVEKTAGETPDLVAPPVVPPAKAP